MTTSPNSLIDLLRQEQARRRCRNALWPTEYRSDDAAGASRFVFSNIETRLETTGTWHLMPDKQYLRWYVDAWYRSRDAGETLIVWKPRRMLLSWMNCALNLYDAGLVPGDILMCGKTYEGKGGAREFVWRIWAMYEHLRKIRPTWELPEAYITGSPDRGELDTVRFANGAIVTAINASGESFRGGGARRVNLEEWSAYPHAGAVMSQARFVVQGPPGSPGGHVVAMCNTIPNKDFLAEIGV